MIGTISIFYLNAYIERHHNIVQLKFKDVRYMKQLIAFLLVQIPDNVEVDNI